MFVLNSSIGQVVLPEVKEAVCASSPVLRLGAISPLKKSLIQAARISADEGAVVACAVVMGQSRRRQRDLSDSTNAKM